jgi:hypothetical protein
MEETSRDFYILTGVKDVCPVCVEASDVVYREIYDRHKKEAHDEYVTWVRKTYPDSKMK